VRLQNATSLDSGWLDVPDTEGQSTTNITIGPGQTFFRLIGP
jgi:hypothetical protein